ncbi:hypothetical protein ACYZT8_20375 [Pseudomonas sp. LB3P93]
MPRHYEKVPRPLRVETLLRCLQEDIEHYGGEDVKQRRRLLLRGFRAGFWVALERPGLEEVARTLRAELFGHPVVLVATAEEDDELCQSGTDSEV